MSTPYHWQRTPRAARHAPVVNPSRAVGRGLSVNHSRAVSAALRG